jgi:hypothetical protein
MSPLRISVFTTSQIESTVAVSQNKKGLSPFVWQSGLFYTNSIYFPLNHHKSIPFLGQYFFLFLTLKRKKVNRNEIFGEMKPQPEIKGRIGNGGKSPLIADQVE